jgi:hypothetical protein
MKDYSVKICNTVDDIFVESSLYIDEDTYTVEDKCTYPSGEVIVNTRVFDNYEQARNYCLGVDESAVPLTIVK